MIALHRFFVGADVVRGETATLTGDQAKQIADVLRLGRGDRVVLVRDGEELELRLDAVARSGVQGVVVERRAASGEPRIHLTLALPLLRGDHGEKAIEAVTQLGVSRIVPFTSERSVVRELSEQKRERWERIARESAETARRGRVPDIGPLAQWPDLFGRLEPPILVAWEGEHEIPLRKAIPEGGSTLSLVIGPEGGLSSDEVRFARQRGAVTVALGPRNLRSETAAIASVAVVVSHV